MASTVNHKKSWINLTFVVLIGTIIITIILLASVPPVSRDALTHHLAVPKIWLVEGILSELPAIPFSYYPMNIDLLYLIPLYLGNDIAPKYIHFGFALLTAGLIFQYLRFRLNTAYGLLGALFFLSIPVIVKLSTTVYVDLGLIFFTTASLLGLVKWMERDYKLKYLILSALWCGLALGTKYNGLIVFLLLSCLVPFIYLRKCGHRTEKSASYQFKALGCTLIFIFVSLGVFSPWMIKNIRMTGNPIYPLHNHFFETVGNWPAIGTSANSSQDEAARPIAKKRGWNHFAVRKVVYGESFWEICIIPMRVFFEGQDDNPKHFDGKLSPLLLILPLLLFLPGTGKKHRRNTEYRILCIFSIAYLLFVFLLVDMRIRWISPIIPAMVILSMLGLERLQRLGSTAGVRWKKRFFNGALVVAVASMLAFNVTYIHAYYQKIDPIRYISGQIDREGYIKQFRPEYELISYINREFSEDSITLCLFIGDRIYYFDRPIRLDIHFLKRAIISSDSTDDIGYSFRSAGIDHIMLRYDLFNNWVQNNLDSKKQALLKLFFQKHVTQIHTFGGYGLFELKIGK